MEFCAVKGTISEQPVEPKRRITALKTQLNKAQLTLKKVVGESFRTGAGL